MMEKNKINIFEFDNAGYIKVNTADNREVKGMVLETISKDDEEDILEDCITLEKKNGDIEIIGASEIIKIERIKGE